MLAETYVENLNWAADHLAVVDQSGLPAPLTAKFAICTSLPLLYWGGNMNDLDMLQGLQRYKEAQIKAVKVSVTSTRNFGECRSVVRKGVIDYTNEKVFYLFDIKHPKQTKVLSRLTWSIKHLEPWMHNKGASDSIDFGKGDSINDYSVIHDVSSESIIEHSQ